MIQCNIDRFKKRTGVYPKPNKIFNAPVPFVLYMEYLTDQTTDVELALNDTRVAADFASHSFSGHKKSAVVSALADCIRQSKAEAACYWCAELLCAGHLVAIWDTFIQVFARHIHTANVRMSVYLAAQFKAFRCICEDECGHISFLLLRNMASVRQLLAQVVCTMAESVHGRGYREVKIVATDLHLQTIADCPETSALRFRAPDASYAEAVYQEADPREVFVAVNELAYAVSVEGHDWMRGVYWVEWLTAYTHARNARGCTDPPLSAARRMWAVDALSMQSDVIWLVWDVCLHAGRTKGGVAEHAIDAAHTLFAVDFRRSMVKKRIGLLYFVIGVLAEPITVDVPILPPALKNKWTGTTMGDMCTRVYTQIQTNEIVSVKKKSGPWN